MEEVVIRLDSYGFRAFLDNYQFELNSRTLYAAKVASCLKSGESLIAMIDFKPDPFSKNQELYCFIRAARQPHEFIRALGRTENQHLIRFIGEQLGLTLSDEDLRSSAPPTPTTPAPTSGTNSSVFTMNGFTAGPGTTTIIQGDLNVNQTNKQ